ncbi:MAG: hypothetical protein NTW78_11505 [Campylobacterales bacterium]|nr:hypothetical protein [Campylobacterales bacterium]
MSKLEHSKTTKFLASYSCWDYNFNKKIRYKFRNASKNFLSNDDVVDSEFVLKVAVKSKKLHYIYLVIMFFIGSAILDDFFNIFSYEYYIKNLTLDELLSLTYEVKSIDESILSILGLFFISWIITFIYDFLRYKNILSILNNDAIEKVDINNYRVPSVEQNICIFSDKKPFIGSGIISKNFSFVLPIDKAKKSIINESSIIDFSEDEIYNSIQESLSKNSNTFQKLYINGTLVNNDNNLLSAIDTGKLEKEIWQEYSKKNNNIIRRYICISNISESEEVQTNFFIRFVKQDTNLFIELTSTLLLPVSSKYRMIEQLSQKISFIRFVIILQTSMMSSIINIFKSLSYGFNFIFNLNERIFEKNRIKTQIEENPFFDYGEKSTLREDISDVSLNTFYNIMDEQQLSKQIEKSFFIHLVKFLDSKNIDTFELTQQETTIINHGLIMSGGEFKAENMALGKKSSIFGSKKS